MNPVALFKGTFEIAPGLGIEVATYKGIRREKLKSLQKYDLTAPYTQKLPEGKEIINDVSHVIDGDETETVVDK